MSDIHQNCQRIPRGFQPRRASRWARFGAITLVLLNVVPCGSRRSSAADPSTESAITNPTANTADQPASQGSVIRIIASAARSTPSKPQATQSTLPSLDERLLAAAIYANSVRANQQELAAAVAPQPMPVQQPLAPLDIAPLLQAGQGAMLAANPPVKMPLKVKMSIEAAASPLAAQPTSLPGVEALPAPVDSQVAIRSVTKTTPSLHAPNRFVEPDFAAANEAQSPATMPAPVASPGVDWADALASAVRQSPAPQSDESNAVANPVVVIDQPRASELEVEVVPHAQAVVAKESKSFVEEPTTAPTQPVVESRPTEVAVAPSIVANGPEAVIDTPPALAEVPSLSTSTIAVVADTAAAEVDALSVANNAAPAPAVEPIPIVATSEPKLVTTGPAIADTQPIAATSLPKSLAVEQPVPVDAPKVVANTPISAIDAKPAVLASAPATVPATQAVTASKPTIAISRFVASSRKSKEEASEPTLATSSSSETTALPTITVHQSAPDWKAEDFVVSQPPVMPTEVRISQVGSQPADLYAMVQAPTADQQQTIPVQTIPTETTVLPVPDNTGAPTMEALGLPPMPMTNGSYLPASPENYCYRCGVKCPDCGCNPGGPGWAASRPIPWEVFAQGEYIGPARLAHVPIYRLRVDDRLAFVYRLSGQVAGTPYRLNVRDRIQVQSLSAPEVINRELIVQPDGTITLPLLGQVRAAGATIDELSKHLDEELKSQIKDPRITVTPLLVNSNLEELRSSVDRRYGAGGQVSDARVSPDGTVQLPAIGLVPAQGMTLDELEREVKTRYARIVEGLEVTPILLDRAPRYIFVVGEVKVPGRYTLEGPTTLMQAISMAGSWNVGAMLNNVVVFRRDENWQLMATRLNVRSSLLFKKPCPDGEIWLRDSDIVLIPKSPILCADDFIDLVFTRGIYGVFPMTAQLNFAKLSTL